MVVSVINNSMIVLMILCSLNKYIHMYYVVVMTFSIRASADVLVRKIDKLILGFF